MSDKVKVEFVFQIGLCVSDLEATLENWKEFFDIDTSSIVLRSTKAEYEAGNIKGLDMYKGEKCEPWFIKYYRLDLGNMDIEIIEPLDKKPGSPYSDWLIEHGNGIHHVAMKFADRPAFLKKMEDMGITPYLGTSVGKTLANGETKNCFFFDMRDQLGLMIESGSIVVGPMAKDPRAGNPADYVDVPDNPVK